MWFIALLFLCASLTVPFPEYTLYIMSLPLLLTLFAVMSENTWRENLFLILIGPLIAILIF